MTAERGKQEPTTAWERVEQELKRLGVSPELLEERFVLGSGKGGQKVNKTASTVQLRDPRSGVEVKCNLERSQYLNRLRARERLVEALEERRKALRLERSRQAAKQRFAKRKPSARQKAKRIDGKRKRGAVKQQRRRPAPGE